MISGNPLPPPSEGDENRLPEGLPRWINDELIERTRQVWQPYYRTRLTLAELVDMLLATGRLYGVLSRNPTS